MINLLPPENKKELLAQSNKHLVAVLIFIIIIALICFVLVLIYIKFYLLSEISLYKNQIQEKNNILSSEKLEKQINTYNNSFKEIKNFYEKNISFTEMIKYFLQSEMPVGVRLNSLSADIKEGNIEVSIYGFSDTRDNLIKFKDNLMNNKYIKSPYFSPESWTKNKSINFYLKFQYEEQK